jgi:hypothetical protein
MKKLLIVLLILGLAVPAMASEVTFSGSTWIVYSWSLKDKDYTGYADGNGDFDGNNNVISIPKAGKSNTLSAHAVASDALSADVVLALGPAPGDSDDSAYIKIAMADWNFGAGHLKFGWGESCATNFFGFPVYIDAGPWIGNGNVYQTRKSQMQLDFGGLSVALRENVGSAGTYSDTDYIIPQIAASYVFANKMLFIKGAGNFQTWTVENHPAAGSQSKTINAYDLSVFGRVNLGPANVGLGAFYQVNPSDLGILLFGLMGPTFNWQLDGSGNVQDYTAMGVALTGGVAISPKLAFNAGVNHWSADAGDLTDTMETTNAFIQAVTGIGPIQFIPEIGYKDLHEYNGVDKGTMFYLTGVFRVFW